MTDLNEIQPTAIELLNGSAYFSDLGMTFNESIFARSENVGAIPSEMEGVLNSKGVYGSVLVPNGGVSEQAVSGVADMRFVLGVAIFENPKTNRDGNDGYKAMPMDLVQETIVAVKEHSNFKLLEGEFYKTRWDDGLSVWVYEVFFMVDVLL
ncbi:hypothetical protein MLD52_09175 [Puniceicoccaceae bacterium K14]|nr:hypothetical protein [Puniceicoccaceae bacterium K14]